jgi:ankyrin repeat protein
VDSLQAHLNAGQIDYMLENGTTLLYEACVSGRVDLALALVELKANVNQANKDGSVPLHACVTARNAQLASLLIRNGALLDLCNSDGSSPAFLAAEIGDVEMCQELLGSEKYSKIDLANPKTGASLLYAACLGNHYNMVKFLLDKKASTSLAIRDSGNTPLHAAAFRCNAPVCQLLVLYGASVNAQSKNGFSPLHVAALSGNADVVNLLLSSGADRNAQVSITTLFYFQV